jgi:hypothetical protein
MQHTYSALVHSKISPLISSSSSGSWSNTIYIDFAGGLFVAEEIKGAKFPSRLIADDKANVSYLLDNDQKCNVYPLDGLPFEAVPWDGILRSSNNLPLP